MILATIKTVSVTYGRKINLGDYNSATADCTVWVDVDPADNLDAVMRGLWGMAKENVKAQVAGATAKPNATLKEYYLGLQIAEADVKEIEELANANQKSN